MNIMRKCFEGVGTRFNEVGDCTYMGYVIHGDAEVDIVVYAGRHQCPASWCTWLVPGTYRELPVD